MVNPQAVLIDSRYQLVEQIGSGGMGVIYRAKDMMTGSEVALKRVTLPSEKLTFTSATETTDFRLALAQEFRLLASIRHPHIISVLDYGFDTDKQPYYTMDLLENPQTIVDYASQFTIVERVRLLIQVSQALAYLHRRGIIHRDLKPENVLVVEDTVKVLDFGLAVRREQMHNNPTDEDTVAGTLAYMAPEILLTEPASEKSDLYSLGMVAYETLVGSHPFDISDPVLLLRDIMDSDPMDLVAAIDDFQVGAVVARLLGKMPEDRFESADEVTYTFSRAINLPGYQETATIRDSYLQAASFVGRKNEMALLTSALRYILPGVRSVPRGSAWLIGGESGVGKSRLMEEIRSLALVEGALVLRGQAANNGVPYQMWRSVIRRLLLSTPIDDFEAGVLREIIPDIETLLGREIPELSEISGRAGISRLALIVADVFKAQTTPILLLLEDLQWANEGLDILREVIHQVEKLPLVVVGTYRNDESTDLPDRLPGMRQITLGRLTESEIRELSMSMLGEQIGQQDSVLGLLERETEGNIFFLVEVVRALAEEAGNLSNIGVITLPDSVFSGSMRTVIERRLSRLPLDAQPMLRLAAVYGREIDLNVLKQIDPVMNYDRWLLTCANAAIIEVVGNSWRFTHDRMRDGILDVLDPSQKPKLNEMIAEAIEDIYPNDDTFAARLMQYWHVAGNREREAHYARIAGRQDFEVGDYREALRNFQRVLDIQGDHTTPDIFLYQGEIHRQLGNYGAAERALENGLRHYTNPLERGLLMAALGELVADEGDYTRAKAILFQALRFGRQSKDASLQSRILTSIGDVVWQLGDLDESTDYLYEASSLAREVGDLNRILQVMEKIGVLTLALGDLEYAEAILEEAYLQAITENHGERAMTLLNNLGKVAQLKGDYDLAEARYLSTLRTMYRLKLRHYMPLFLTNLGSVRILYGDTITARFDLQAALKQARQQGAIPWVLGAVVGFAALQYEQGEREHALELLATVLQHPAYNRETERDVVTWLARWGLEPSDIGKTKLHLEIEIDMLVQNF